MGDSGPNLCQTLRSLLIAAVLCLASGAALAVPITDYITVQPIDVCTGNGTGCAPINNKGQTFATAPLGSVGFIDAASGINVTNAIWNQLGIGVTFLSAVQYPNSGAFQTINVASCSSNGTDCQSPQFQTLSQQPGIAGNPPPSTPPTPPLSTNPTTVNMFFVNRLNPPANQPGNLYGLGWINNNGVAISSNTLLGVAARPDTLAHEIGHDLDLDHNTFGAGAANNLLSAGIVRTEPTSTANALTELAAGTADQLNSLQQAQMLQSGFVNPVPNVDTKIQDPTGILVGQCVEFTACYSSNTSTPWSSMLTLASLQSLGLGTTQPFVAAQTSQFIIRLGQTTIAFDTPTGPVTESLAAFSGNQHSDPCNFCEVDTVGSFFIPANALDAMLSGTFGNSIVPNSAGVDLCLGAGLPCVPPFDFSVSFDNQGRPNESLNQLILAAPDGIEFDPSSFSQLNLPGGTPGTTLIPTFSGCTSFGELGERCSLLTIGFAGNPFVLGDNADYTVGFCRVAIGSCDPDTNVADLGNGTYTYQFSDGYQTTSLLAGDSVLDASSWNPDPTIPSEIYDFGLFSAANLGRLPCTQVDGSCPVLQLGDGSPLEEGGQPVPEPSPIMIVVLGVGVALILHRRTTPRPASSSDVFPKPPRSSRLSETGLA